ncbi:MAG: enoyl-[acyl-carrier-protein] reductase FabL [Anaerolineaceae bacterium]|nr:enoyl-[acyl-carrier-protein] reductase FabL [Anaerolineaceae bacterium]
MQSAQFLAGKIALITGSGRGIGKAIAIKFAQLGADIVVNYSRNRVQAEETAEIIHSLGRKAVVLKSNIAKEEEIKLLFNKISDEFGKLDILVNNAASGFNRPLVEQKITGWDHTMNVNVRAAMLCSQYSIPLMEKAGSGYIINISSPGSTRVLPDYIAVGASKAALESLTRYMAIELAPKKIRVNAVSPGLVETDALKHFAFMTNNDVTSRTIANTPAGRLVTPEDVAETVAFLCSSSAEMICGQVIVIDGGFTLIVPK